jgi:hypothetical protein
MSTRPADDKGKAGKPSDYDGSPTRFRAWWREVNIYLRAKKIMDNEERILTTLSYMKTGLAASWADHFWDENSTKPTLGAWLDFEKDIKETFSTKDVAKAVRQHLEDLRQGTCMIDEFFTIFESMASDAELTGAGFDAERIRTHRVTSPSRAPHRTSLSLSFPPISFLSAFGKAPFTVCGVFTLRPMLPLRVWAWTAPSLCHGHCRQFPFDDHL